MTLERLVVIHCSPTLSALKCSSLVCLKNAGPFRKEELDSLEEKGVHHLFLTNRIGCPLLFLYRPGMLERIIRGREESEILKPLGYDTSSLSASLERLSERLMEDSFPHEIGIFLGYPVEDVKSFIQNHGENYILSGVWKVYHDKETAERTFRLYSECTRCLVSRYDNGTPLEKLCAESA